MFRLPIKIVRFELILTVLFVILLTGSALPHSYVVNYDPNGAKRWSKELPYADGAYVGLDRVGRVYVAGLYQETCAIRQFVSTGESGGQWRFDVGCSELIPQSDRFVLLALHEVEDSENGGYYFEEFISAFDLDGNHLWDYAGDEIGEPSLVMADPTGGYVVASGIELARLDQNGALLFTHRYYKCSEDTEASLKIKTDGMIVVAGCHDESTYVQWYDVQGSLVHSSTFPGWDGKYGDGEPKLVLDHEGNAVVANRCAMDEGCIARFSSTGAQLWLRRFPFSEDGWLALALTVDAEGQAVVAVNNYWYAEVIKYDVNGNELWASRIENGDMPNTDVFDLAADRYGNTYVVAQLCDKVGHDGECEYEAMRYVTIKYSPLGNRDWMAGRDYDTVSDDIDVSYSDGSVYSVYELLNSRIYLSPELDPSVNDSGPAVYYNDDSDSAGCGC